MKRVPVLFFLKLTGLTEDSAVCWQTETPDLSILLGAGASIQTGVIQTEI